ncbi:MAG: hypothetical protein AAB864_01640 [Patescibacteria group bacterium]
MPIKPENAARYPKNWKQLRAAVLDRAGHKCEQCGVENYTYGWRDITGKFHQVDLDNCEMEGGVLATDAGHYEGLAKVIKIVLTIAHLEHDNLETQDISQLRAWCQKCHLAYDHEHHQRNARETRRSRKANGDLFA